MVDRHDGPLDAGVGRIYSFGPRASVRLRSVGDFWYFQGLLFNLVQVGQTVSRHNRFVTGECADLSIHLEKVLQAPVERVFAACVEPVRLAEWWGPAHFTTPGLELDVCNGGRYRITMQPPAGDAFHLRGEFREVDPPRRLVYTFVWEEPVADDQETVVTLSFLGCEATKLVVDQGPFATEARRALHEAGWTESLERLEAFLVGGRHDR